MQTLGDLGEVVSGGTPSRTVPSFWNGSIPWATPTDITRLQNKYISTTAEKITKNGLEGSSAHLLPAGSLLVTSRATLGEAAIATVPIATNQGFKSIVPNAETHRVFAYYLVKTLKPKMLPLASGTTFLEIGKGDFCRIPVRIPDFDEQSRIAYVLDTIDEAIQKTEAVIAKLKQIRAGMLHDLLTYGLDKDGKLRDPVAHPEQFKDSELGLIPKEWEVAEIVQLFDLGRGRVISQHDLRACPGDYPVYSSQSANDGIFGYLGTFDFEGDYITWTTDGANAGTVFFRSGRFNCTNVCGTLKSKGRITEAFGALALGTVAKKHVSYVGNPKLMNNIVARIKIKYPKSIDEQQAAVMALEEIDQNVAAEARELRKLMMTKVGLIDDLLRGDVPVPEDLFQAGEPA